MAQSFKRKRTLCLSFFFPNIFRSPWNTRENFREYSLRLCVKTNVKFAHWVVTPIKTVLTFSNQAFCKLLFIISFLNVLWNYGGKVFLKRLLLNPRTYTQIHTPTEVQGEGGGEVVMNPSLEFLICCSISKRFCLQWKAFDLLNKMRYILWVVALLEACDVTNNVRHLGFYQKLEIKLKRQEVVFFFVWHIK